MPTSTTNMGLHKAIDGDDTENYLTVSDAADKDILDVHRHGGGADGLAVKAIIAGVVASRPAAGVPGRVYFATDTGIVSYDDGTDWDDFVDNDSTQTVAGKTFTSPILTTPTINAPTFVGRMQGAQGANVASANNLTLGSDGNAFAITGSTQINLLDSTGWQNGSVVSLYFPSGLTVKNAVAASGAFKSISLAGGVDFVAAINATLTLTLFSGVWIETGRRA